MFLRIIILMFFMSPNTVRAEISQDELKKFFSENRVGRTPDYAVLKNGHDYLMTIHGYHDNRFVCEELIKPYNKDQSLSVIKGVYQCI